MWDTSSLKAMEETAKVQADGMCCKRMKTGLWLEVTYLTAVFGSKFDYTYNGGSITRECAESWFQSS